MALGYEGFIRLRVDGPADIALGTGGAVPDTRARLESSAGYGGQINTPANQVAINNPRSYDWQLWEGSIDFEVHEGFLSRQIKPWIFNRQKAAEVYLQSRTDNVQLFNNCYWSELTLTGAEGQIVTGSAGFTSVQRDTYTIGGGYPTSGKTGMDFFCGSTGPAGATSAAGPTGPGDSGTYVPTPLNPQVDSWDGSDIGNTIPVPFWNTSVVIDGSSIDFVDWSFNLSQEVVPFFACEHQSGPQEPRFISVGSMSATFSGTHMFVGSSAWGIPDSLSTLNLLIGGETIKTATLERTEDSDPVVGSDEITSIPVEYYIYELIP